MNLNVDLTMNNTVVGPYGSPPPKEGIQMHTKAKDPQAVFLHFLETGTLPLNDTEWSLHAMQDQLLEQARKDPHFYGAPTGGSAFCHNLLHLLLENEAALTRILSQFGEVLLDDLYGHTIECGMVSRWIGLLADTPGLDLKRLRWQVALYSLVRTKGKISLEAYPKVEKGIVLCLLREVQPIQLFRWVSHLNQSQLEKLLGVLDIPFDSSSDLREVLSIIHRQTAHLHGLSAHRHVSPATKHITPDPKEGEAGSKTAGTGAQVTGSQAISPHVTSSQATGPQKGASVSDTYIDNAGLILLHPFLPDVFRQLGWWDERGFTKTAEQQRAVLLTQQMVRPADFFPEYQLLLNKILCGYRPGDALPLSLDECTLPEQLQISNVLNTMLNKWTINGNPVNNTIQSLRESFLQRRGKLVRREHDWVLQVEQKAYDIVLHSTPWSIRTIRNPWMPETLWVEWV